MKLAAIRNITFILGLTLNSHYTDSTGTILFTPHPVLVKEKLNIFYLTKYVANLRFVKLNRTEDFMAKYKSGICDSIISAHLLGFASSNSNLSATGMFSQPRCVAAHTVRKPIIKSVNILWSIGISSNHFTTMIIISIFSILLIISCLAVNNSKLMLILQISFVWRKVLANFTGISPANITESTNFSSNIVITSFVIFLLILQILFGANFTTDMTIAEKDQELERIEMLDTWNLKSFMDLPGYCSSKILHTQTDRFNLLRQRGVFTGEKDIKDFIFEAIENDPGMVVAMIDTDEWHSFEIVYYDLPSEYVKKNYLYHSQSIDAIGLVYSYNNVRAKKEKEKLKLILDWSRGLLEMNLYKAAIKQLYLYVYKKRSTRPDQFKNLRMEPEVRSLNFTFISPCFIFLWIAIGISSIIFILEKGNESSKNRALKIQNLQAHY